MKRRKPPRRKARLRQRNPKRRKRLYAEQFGTQAAWIRTLPCCICRRPSMEDAPTTSSHVRGRGAGGKSEDQVPMCGECHTYYEGHKREWNAAYRLPELAAALAALWEQMEGKCTES